VQAAANLQSALATIAKDRAGPIVVWETPKLIANGKAIGEMTFKQRIPTIGFKEVAEGGGLVAYGANLPDMWRRSAVYVDKILRGAKPGDIPVEQATKFEMIVNLRTAREFRLTVPQSIVLRADKVIE
jgi:putative ABC transport system substrate-binding protein